MLIIVSSFCTADDMYAAFVTFDGISGEEKVVGTPGWISLLNLELGVLSENGAISSPVISFAPTKIITPALNSIEGLGGMSFACVKELDKTSPKLLSVFNQRIRIPEAKLCLCSLKNLDEPLKEYHLFDVLISKHGQEGDQETLVLDFKKISEIK